MENNLSGGNVLKNIIVFSLPFLLSNFLQTLYGLADLFITGQYNSKDIITAVAVGSQIMHMVTVVITGFAMGSVVLIGRAVGAKEPQKVSKITGFTCILFLITAVILTGLLILFCPAIISSMDVPAESVKQTADYLYICFAGIPCIVAYNVTASVFRGMGDSKSPMIFIAVACVFNIFLDYVFIGKLNMQAAGAAYATVTAQFLSVVISFIAIKKAKLISVKKSDFKFDADLFKKMLKIGFPVACQEAFIQISFLLITKIANSRGVSVAAAVGIVEKIICFLFLVPSSMLSSVTAVASQNIGAKNFRAAHRALFCGALIAAGAGFIFSAVFQFAAEPFLTLFTKDTEVQNLASQYLKSYVLDCAFGGIQFSFSGFFCACGKSLYAFTPLSPSRTSSLGTAFGLLTSVGYIIRLYKVSALRLFQSPFF